MVATCHGCVHDPELAPYKTRQQAAYHHHWIRPQEARTLHQASAVTAVSGYAAGQTERTFGLSRARVIPNWLPDDGFEPIVRPERPGPFGLISVGSWCRRKGVDLLAPIMRRLSDGFLLIYTGTPSKRDHLPTNMQPLGWAKSRAQVRAWLQEADVMLFPSRLKVIRFPYFIRRWENLSTHGGGILSRLHANPLNYLLVPPFLLGQVWALVRLLRRGNWDLIHAHWLIPQGIIALVARWLARRPVVLVCTSHGGDLFALRGGLFRSLKRAVLDASARVTVVSATMRNEVVALGIDADRVAVVPMGVDLRARFTPEPAIARHQNELLFVGRLVEKKGVALLLQALAQVLQAFPDTRLTIAGGGPLEAELRRLSESLGISNHVDFRGMVSQDDLPALYRRATLFVAPFLVASSGDQEGFGLVLVEAMGCGCPVICGNVPAVRDIVHNDETGVLANPQDLADAIVRLLADPIRSDATATLRTLASAVKNCSIGGRLPLDTARYCLKRCRKMPR